MSFQWNHSGSGRQVGNQTQPMSQWSNQDQYNPGHQYGMQENRTASSDWSTGVSYHQWCPPTSQEQMNWGCTSHYNQPMPNNSSSHYNQPMPNNFTSNVYPRHSHTKSNFGDNFTGLYEEPERNNVFDYPMTNSFMSRQGNDGYGMSQNSFVNSCQEPAKMGRSHTANDNFLYWNQSRSESESMNYMPYPLYNSHAGDNVSSSSSMPIKADMDSNHMQEELMQTYDEKPERTHYSRVSKPDLTNSRFSNSPPSDYFMGMMSHDNITSNMSPIHDNGNTKKYFNSLCPIDSVTDANSSLVTSRYSQATAKGNFRFGNNLQNRLEMTSFLKKEAPTPAHENFLQEENLDLEERGLHTSDDFKKVNQIIEQSDFGKTYKEMYQMSLQNFGGKVPQSATTENIEGDMKWEAMGHNVPSYIDFTRHADECGPTGKEKCVPSWKDECEPSIKNQYMKSSQQNQNPRRLKTQPSQNFSNDPKSENSARKAKKAEEQIDSNVPPKNSPAKKVRRAVLKYLLKQSSHIEKCFGELRHVKKMLKDNPADKEVIKILSRVEMQINQSRLSLKEKKKVCSNSNIRLRSLTIKSTGTNILQTLESDMYHLRRFYSALSHIARHLGTIEKPSQESQNPSGTSTEECSFNPSHSHFLDEPSNSNKDVMSPKDSHHENPLNIREKFLNGPPQKSARFMYLERRYWDRLMEISYLIRSKILALRQAERAYKNGKKESLAELKTMIETPHGGLKRDYKLLIHWKKRYNFSRHIPSYILERYPEQERRSRDKITLKSVRKNLATFMSLCFSTNVLIRSSKVIPSNQNADTPAEEVKFWKRLVILNQKIQMYQSELSKLQLALTANRQDKKSLDALIRIEARVKEVDCEIQKEEVCKQKNGFCDVMPNNAEIQRLKLSDAECKNFLVLREALQNMKTTLSEVKCLQAVSSPNPELSVARTSCINDTPNPKQRGTPVTVLSQELPSDLAQLLGDGPSGWM